MTAAPSGLEGLHPDFVDPVERPCVFTTLRWDPALLDVPENTEASCKQPNPIYLFEHHWSRLQVAKWGTSWYSEDDVPARARTPAHLFQIVSAAVQQWQRQQQEQASADSLRVKVRCYVGGQMAVEVVPVNRLPAHRLFPKSLDEPREAFGVAFDVYLDTQSTEANEETMFKTSRRDFYARARREVNIPSLAAPQEVLLYSPDGAIFDASISTPYFFRDGSWVAPTSACGGQQGATRRWALEKRLAVEAVIHIDSLKDGELMWLSNGVKGYFPAVYRARQKSISEK